MPREIPPPLLPITRCPGTTIKRFSLGGVTFRAMRLDVPGPCPPAYAIGRSAYEVEMTDPEYSRYRATDHYGATSRREGTYFVVRECDHAWEPIENDCGEVAL